MVTNQNYNAGATGASIPVHSVKTPKEKASKSHQRRCEPNPEPIVIPVKSPMWYLLESPDQIIETLKTLREWWMGRLFHVADGSAVSREMIDKEGCLLIEFCEFLEDRLNVLVKNLDEND